LSALPVVACQTHHEPPQRRGERDFASGADGRRGSDRSGPLERVDREAGAVANAAVRAWDWNGVVGTGQSLSVGAAARDVTLTTQPFGNLKLALGGSMGVFPYDANDPSLSVVPLVEPIRTLATSYPSAYPLNVYGETPHTAMADEISALYRNNVGRDYVTVHTVVGESGQGIHVIDKKAAVTNNLGHAYAATLFEVSALERLSAASDKTYGVGAIILTHGEADGGNLEYENDLVRLYSDSNADISVITKQKKKIPLLLTQQQTSPGDNSPAASLMAEWRIGIDYPDEIICVGPKYQYPYASDHLHLVAGGYDQLGEKYGEVYYDRVVLGRDWQPLQPVSARRSGSTITVDFHVPFLPLAWDEGMPSPHATAHTAWAKGRGFEVEDQNGEQTIASVAIRGSSVAISLASAAVGPHLVVRYAVTQDGNGSLGGLATGRVGQLRDSDPLVGYATKLPQYNYAVSFVMSVN
jgi:hypothetical protein